MSSVSEKIISEIVYLDNNATTPCAPEVLDFMIPFYQTMYGNAGSSHKMGRQSANAIAVARQQVADTIGCLDHEVIFTSGATESNNMVLMGLFRQLRDRNKIVTCSIEHKSILAPCHILEEDGFEVQILAVDANGSIDLEEIKQVIDENTLLVAIQGANNEIGTMQPIQAISALAHDKGALIHADLAQLLGKMPIDLGELAVDFASFSAHKAYGPKGVGALYIKSDIRGNTQFLPVMHGGGQEYGYRPGTQNVPGIVGFGEACRLVQNKISSDILFMESLKNELEERLLSAIPGIRINAKNAPRLPNTSSICIPDVPADMLLSNLSKTCISDGSACNAGAISPSHVLLAIGLTRDEADCSIRICVGRYNDMNDIKQACDEIESAVSKIRQIN